MARHHATGGGFGSSMGGETGSTAAQQTRLNDGGWQKAGVSLTSGDSGRRLTAAWVPLCTGYRHFLNQQ